MFNAQNTIAQFKWQTNIVTKKIATQGFIKLSDEPIVPQSFFIQNTDSTFYTLNTTKGILIWNKKLNEDSVWISFRKFSFPFYAPKQRFNYEAVQNNFLVKPFTFNTNNRSANSNSVFNFGNMQYNGSFGRSLSFGNNQDAVFNSQLNLQISGMLADSIEIAAAITDNNIPIQPDGTTQQLNEFDKIIIQLKKKNWELNLGDIDARENENYFLKFYKRLQGVTYQQSNGNKSLIKFAGAIAKGKFTRNIFQGIEGNQGPYRLQGNNNEFYLIILSNTERVFIDGELLQRGEDQDYIINYNTAEITFTPKRMITKDKRIQVEFEYADRNYLNAIFFVKQSTQVSKQFSYVVAAYSNADAKNSTINQSLDVRQKQFLADIGDSIQNAFYKVATIDSFSTSKILYAKVVNPYNPLWDSIFVYSTNPTTAKYNLNFINVGSNNGNYINYFNSANGKVYQYVSPINGIKQGNYEAATFLITPKKQQVISIASQLSVTNNTTLFSDIALSNYDVNTFSRKDKSNNYGYAAKFLLQQNASMNGHLQLNTTIGYEWVNQNFKPVERLREVEFARDWGLPLLPNIATEHLPKAMFELKNITTNLLVKYKIDGYVRSDNFNAFRNSFEIKNESATTGLQVNAVASIVNNTTPFEKGSFIKTNAEVLKIFNQLHQLQIGIGYLLENNLQHHVLADTLTPLSFSFQNISFFIKSNPSEANNWSFTFFTRKDELPIRKQLLTKDRSSNYNISLQLFKNIAHQFKVNVTYRNLTPTTLFINQTSAENSLLGRFEYAINEWNGLVVGNVLYEVGSGQEQRKDFSFFEVPAGRGEYAWIDYNNDGVQQLNEFEIALFTDQAKYIKIYTPTNQFIKSNYSQFNYTVCISPRAISNYIQHKQLKNLVSRFNIQSSIQLNNKTQAANQFSFKPLIADINDTAIINLNNTLNNTVSFNRFSSHWGFDITNFKTFNKALLTYGFESRTVTEWQLKLRGTIKKQFTVEFNQKIGNQNLSTPKFANRNYQIDITTLEPKFIYTYSSQFRIAGSFLMTQKNNAQQYGGEKSVHHSIHIETKYNAINNISLFAKCTYSNINFEGINNTAVSYMMLDGLLAGKNYLWNFELSKRLGNNLELSLNYEGRKPGETRVINIGRASLRAIL